MSAPIADSVLAATHKLVQQAMTGRWQDVPKTVEERRVLLESLVSSAQPQDRAWVDALKQAMAESDAAVAKMAATRSAAAVQSSPVITTSPAEGDAVALVMDMLAKGG